MKYLVYNPFYCNLDSRFIPNKSDYSSGDNMYEITLDSLQDVNDLCEHYDVMFRNSESHGTIIWIDYKGRKFRQR